MKKHFWICARCTTEPDFLEQMNVRKKLIARPGQIWIFMILVDQWCKAFFRFYPKCDALDNNLSESFNNTLVKCRSKPIIPMLESIRVATMKRIAKKVKFGNRWQGNIGPRIMKKLNTNIYESMGWKVVFNGHDDYEVKRGRHQYQVRLEGRTCSCRVWELNGIPCSHAVCAILDNGGDPETYVDECYSKEVYQRIYSHHLQRMNGELMWKKTQQNDIQAPIPKKMTGWPKKKRKREATEGPSSATTMTRKGRVMTCFICKVAGYNKSKCPTSPMERQTQTRERKRALVKNQA